MDTGTENEVTRSLAPQHESPRAGRREGFNEQTSSQPSFHEKAKTGQLLRITKC